jgi:hypothetical protein
VTVVLTNTSRRCQVFVLSHETYCRARGECACILEEGRKARRTATSLTLASGHSSPQLDDAVLVVPDVVRAIRRGEILVERQVVELPRPPALAPPTLAPSPGAGNLAEGAKAKKKRGEW